jgi:hypothetical protein
MGFVFHRSWTLQNTRFISHRNFQLTEQLFSVTSNCGYHSRSALFVLATLECAANGFRFTLKTSILHSLHKS